MFRPADSEPASSLLEDRVREGIREILSGGRAMPLPRISGRLGNAARLLSELFVEPPTDSATTDAVIAECTAAGWQFGLAATGLLGALPALERVEHRLVNRPESLRREATGWSMLSRRAARRLGGAPPGDGDPLPSLAPLLAMGEVARLERELAAATGENLSADAPALEGLLDCASVLRSDEAVARVAAPLLEALADAVHQSLRAGDWPELAARRARYLRRWHQLSRTVQIPRAEAQLARPYLATCRLIGETVGGMHHHTKMVSHALFLENFDEQGTIRNLGAAEIADNIAAFALDLVPLRFQLWGRHLEEFYEGYREAYGADREQAWITLVMTDRLAGASRGPDPDGAFPSRHLQLPHFVVRAAGHLLRTDVARRPDFTTRLQAIESPREDMTPAERLDVATAVLVEAADLDQNAAAWAVTVVQNTILELFRAGRADLALPSVELCLHEAEDTVLPELLDPVRGLAWVLRADLGGFERAVAMRRAATWFTRAGKWEWVRHCLQDALAATDAEAERAELELALLRAAIDAALDTDDGEHVVRTLERYQPPIGLSDELNRRLDAHHKVARSLLTRDRTVQHGMIREAIALVAELSDPLGFRALITGLVPPWESDSGPRDPLAEVVPRETMEALYRIGSPEAVERLTADLALLHADGAPMPHQLRVASRLAVVAIGLADQTPRRRADMAHLAAELARDYRPVLTGAGPDPGDPELVRSAANNIGWAAVTLLRALPDDAADELLLVGIALLERAVELAPPDTHPYDYSSAASNLAMGYRDRAQRLHQDARPPLLHRARELAQSVLEVDERQVREGAAAADVGLDIDHINLGLICNELADASYEAQWISRKSMESARQWRAAARHFDQARTIALSAGEFARAGTAASMFADIAATICGWYVRERSYAAGDLQPAMYDWLRTAAGVEHVSTADFITLCAGTAIDAAAEAATIGQERNPSLLLESIQVLLKLYNLAERQLYNLIERRHGLPPATARDIRMTILERLQAVADAGLDRTHAEQLTGFDDVLSLLTGQFRLDLFELTGDPDHITRAHALFDELSGPVDKRRGRRRDPVVRALARPQARWLDVQMAESATTICGLSLGGRADGLHLWIPAQGRDLQLRGLVPQRITTGLMPTGDARELARFATSHLRPLLDWDPLPAAVAQATLIGLAAGTPWQLEAVALPMPTWDSWMLRLTKDGSDPIRLRPSLPFLGTIEPATGSLDAALPASASDHTRVLLFGQPGLTLHVLLPADMAGWEEAPLRLHGTAAEPELEIGAGETFLLLQATPRISASQVAFLIKSDDAVSGAACAASFWPDFPDPGMPATAVQMFSALFPFDAQVPEAALAHLDELPVTVTAMVGLPDDHDQLAHLLEALTDPRRELLLVVDADEFPRVAAAAARLKQQVLSGTSAGLLESAASLSAYHEALSGLQVVCAPRSMAPAAVQMLLDLAALRRVNPDDVPESIDGRPVYLSTKGNPIGMRRRETLFTEPVSFGELLDRYTELSRRRFPMLAGDEISPIRERLINLTIPRRPVLLLAPGDPAVVAAVPLARHLGAIPLFADEDGLAACTALAPDDVYAVPVAVARLLSGPWTVYDLPADPGELAGAFQQLAVAEHADLLASLPATHPALVAGRELLTEMGPADYVMLVTDSPTDRPWAFLATNYAAALGAPVLVVDSSLPQRDPRLPAAARVLDGTQWRPRAAGRDLLADVPPAPDLVPIGLEALGQVGARLGEMGSRYLGFMTPRADFPIELVGEPPLATRYAVGRLAGPDLESTALLVVRAALAEDVPRPTRISALVADAAAAVPAAPLPGARAEAAAVRATLGRQPDIDTTFVAGEGDLFDFVAGLPGAALVHFAGHGRYDAERPHRSGLMFDSGVLSPRGVLDPLRGAPIIFSNACESGVLDAGRDPAGTGGANAAWTGLAATFLLNGATNYLGSLWPIGDESSRTLAETFYRLLCTGTPVGEALRQARLAVRAAGDPTWAAFVLFGCPRNRIRPPGERSGGHEC